MKRRGATPRIRVLLFGLLACLVQACANPPDPRLEEEELFDAAVASEATDPGEAARRLEAFLKTYQTGPLAMQAAKHRADLALAAGDRTTAIFWLRWLLGNRPKGERRDNIRVDLARLAYQAGDESTVAWALEDVRPGQLTEPHKRLFYRLRADTATDPIDRLRWLTRSREAAMESDVRAEVLELLDAELARVVDGLSAIELLRAAEVLDRIRPAARVVLRLAALNMEAGDWEAAEEELAAAAALELDPSDRELQADLEARLEVHRADQGELLPSFAEVALEAGPDLEGASGTLAVVVPMSGPYASYGEESLRGVLLAAGIFDPMPEPTPEALPETPGEELTLPVPAPEDVAASSEGELLQAEVPSEEPVAPGVRVVVYDTTDVPERAAAAVRAVALEEEVAAVIGPLRADASEAAAAAAEEVHIPLLALTTREEIARDRAYVFRVRTTPEDELRYLVDYAFEQKGARRFAILHPDDGYGRGMRDYFWKMVVERGGYVVGVSSYPPDATDFSDSIRKLVGFSMRTAAEGVALAERDAFLQRSQRLRARHAQLAREVASGLIGPENEPLPPIVDFDALFIPDGYENIGLIAPALAFHEVKDVLLLGAGGWVNPVLLDIAEEHVEGAIISSLFDPTSRFPFVVEFVYAYRTVFGGEPDVFAAQAYDAANLVLGQLASGRRTREEIRHGLLRTRAWPGASGVISIEPDGNARKRPFLLEVGHGGFVPLD